MKDRHRRGLRILKPQSNDNGSGERDLSPLVTPAEEPKTKPPLPCCELTGAGFGLEEDEHQRGL